MPYTAEYLAMNFSAIVQHVNLSPLPDRALMTALVADLSILEISVLPSSSTQSPRLSMEDSVRVLDTLSYIKKIFVNKIFIIEKD